MAFISCKNCGCKMSDKSEACPVCGTPVDTVIIEECDDTHKTENQTAIENDDIRCENIPQKSLSKTESSIENSLTPSTPEISKNESDRKKAVIIGVIAVAAVIVILVLLFGSKEKHDNTKMNDYATETSSSSNDYSWMVGTWTCDMGSLGTIVLKLDGDGTSGDCTEISNGSYNYGTYYVSGNTLHYKINGESVTTTLEIEPDQKLCAGGGYYFHKGSSKPTNTGKVGYKQTASGLYYKFITKNEGETLKVGDVVEVVFSYSVQDTTGRDTLLFSSKEALKDEPFNDKIRESIFVGDYYEGLRLMHKGDSISMYINTDSVFIKMFGVPKDKIPKFIKPGSDMRWEVKVVDFK